MSPLDAVVVGSGPNGLAAALTLARAGLAVEVHEGAPSAGGGCRTEELTLPGFRHDTCSSVHPLLVASPFFKDNGGPSGPVPLVYPEIAVAHPLDGSRAVAISGSVTETAQTLGADSGAYRKLFERFVEAADSIVDTVLAPPLRRWPEKPVTAARFAACGLLPASVLARRFETDEARALLAGVAGHSILPLESPLSGAFALLLTILAHSAGWPVVVGGSAGIAEAMTAELEGLGGTVVTGSRVTSLDQLPPARVVLADVTPRQLVAMAGPRLGRWNGWQLRQFRYGPGVCKVDWALSGPVPWSAPVCRRSATIHLGATFEEIAAAESDVAAGRHPARPYCIVVQPGIVDPSRAPDGGQTLWAYCHTPSGSTVDMTAAIEAQVERFAPGFKDLILARTKWTAAEEEQHNPNYVGGDITSGTATLRQTLFRPTVRWNPYRTGAKGVYLCGASTPPGAGVHGMCGYWAARTALDDLGMSASR